MSNEEQEQQEKTESPNQTPQKVAEAIVPEKLRTQINNDQNSSYGFKELGELYFATTLYPELNIKENFKDYLNNSIKNSSPDAKAEALSGFLGAASQAIKEGDKETQDKTKNITNELFNPSSIKQLLHNGIGHVELQKHTENNPEFIDHLLEEALKEEITNDEVDHFLGLFDRRNAIFGKEIGEQFENKFERLIDNNCPLEHLERIYALGLNDDIDRKVITTLAEKHPDKFKDMFKDKDAKLLQVIKACDDEIYKLEKGFQKYMKMTPKDPNDSLKDIQIQENKIKKETDAQYLKKNLKIGEDSILKSFSNEPEVAAKLMKHGYTLSKEEIKEKGYKAPNGKEFTANDHIRMAIGEMSGKKIDLTKKKSPLALARETGQTELANALKKQ
ncbi:MAG: hypothetical protein N4A31_07510 [Rickettsiales bacterium]|nr:hypothetical protein [Rickettsiales bacterium]